MIISYHRIICSETIMILKSFIFRRRRLPATFIPHYVFGGFLNAAKFEQSWLWLHNTAAIVPKSNYYIMSRLI